MATTSSSLIDRVESLLMDSSNRVFDVPTVTEGVRLALGEYNLARESGALAAVTLSGLDGAVSTTLAPAHDSVIVLGAAGYTASARSVDRAESFELEKESTDLGGWAVKRLAEFRAMLTAIHPGYAGASAGGSSGGSTAMDPGLLAATIAHLGAQADLLTEQATQTAGQESRAAAAAVQAAADAAAEAARKAELRGAVTPPWGAWKDDEV